MKLTSTQKNALRQADQSGGLAGYGGIYAKDDGYGFFTSKTIRPLLEAGLMALGVRGGQEYAAITEAGRARLGGKASRGAAESAEGRADG